MFVCTGNPAICVPNIRNELDKTTIINRKIIQSKIFLSKLIIRVLSVTHRLLTNKEPELIFKSYIRL